MDEIWLDAPSVDPAGDYLRASLRRLGLTVYEGEDPPEGYRGLVMASVSLKTALDALNGVGHMFYTLGREKPVWAPLNGRRGHMPQNALGERGRAGLRLLCRAGLTLCPLEDIPLRAARGEGAVRGLVTARRAEALALEGRRWLYLAPGSRITPLGLDRARELGMTVVRGEEPWKWDG